MENNTQQKREYPVIFEVDYPERSSRLLALCALLFYIPKFIILVPHLIMLWFLGIIAFFISTVGFLVVLFVGKYPKSLFYFLVGILRWQARVNAWLYSLTDKYPPFSLE